VKVVVLCSNQDISQAVEIRKILTDLGISVSARKVLPDWENCEGKGLDELISEATHLVLVLTKNSKVSGWARFTAGYAMGRNLPLLVHRKRKSLQLSSLFSRFAIAQSKKEIIKYFTHQKKIQDEKEHYDDILRQIREEGLPFSQEGFIQSVVDGNKKAVNLFLQAGFSPDIRTQEGVPVLSLAVRHHHREIVNQLLTYEAEIDFESEDRATTALMDAAAEGQSGIVKALIDNGAKLDKASKNAQTALILAVGRGFTDISSELIRAGADVERKDKLGMSARKYAKLFNNEKILNMIAERDKKKENKKDTDSNTENENPSLAADGIDEE